MKEREVFDQMFADAVHEGMNWINGIIAPIFNAYVKDATILEDGWRRSRANAQDAKALEQGLERIFGSGAKVFERRILEILCSKLQLDHTIRQDFRFSDEVQRAKELYMSKLQAGLEISR